MPLYLILHYCFTRKLCSRLQGFDFMIMKEIRHNHSFLSYLNFITVDVVLLCLKKSATIKTKKL